MTASRHRTPREPEATRHRTSRSSTRRDYIVEVSGALFADRGYEGASMRDIAAAVGMMPASLYNHFSSKEELLVQVMDESLTKVQRAVDKAIADIDDPWCRLEAAFIALVEALLDRSGFRVLLTFRLPPDLSDDTRRYLITQRKMFEKRFANIVKPFKLHQGLSRRIFNNLMMNMISGIPSWYAPHGTVAPDEIGRQVAVIIKNMFTISSRD